MQRILGALLCAAPAAAQSRPTVKFLSYADVTGVIQSLKLEGGRTELETADVNGDGYPDIASVGDHGSPFINTSEHGLTFWLAGGGGWTLVQQGNFGYGGLALGDVDGDGFLDAGYGVHHNYSSSDFGDQILEVALGDGTGSSWTPWDDGLATNGEDYGMFGTDFGDVDGDGDLDVGSNSFGCCAGVHVYANNGDGTWTQTFGFLGGNSDMDFRFVDFDGDGHLDIATANSLGKAWRGDGQGGFAAANGNLGSSYPGVTAGDLDADGRDELILVTTGGLPRVWSWTVGNVWVERTGNLSSFSVQANLADVADMNRDGRAELVTSGKTRLAMFTLQGFDSWSGVYFGKVGDASTATSKALRAGADLDHNGYPDVTLVQSEPVGTSQTRNFHYVLAEEGVPERLDIAARTPGRQRVWRVGQVRFVEWTSAVPSGAPGTVTLELSTNGGNPPWTSLAMNVPNNGSTQVVVPPVMPSKKCVVRYSVTAGSETRSALGPRFEIR